MVQTPIPEELPGRHLREALVEAVRIGNDTDTVAAIAGMLLGARWGASAVPSDWCEMLHGWLGLEAAYLTRLVLSTASGRGGWQSGAFAPAVQAGGPVFDVGFALVGLVEAAGHQDAAPEGVAVDGLADEGFVHGLEVPEGEGVG